MGVGGGEVRMPPSTYGVRAAGRGRQARAPSGGLAVGIPPGSDGGFDHRSCEGRRLVGLAPRAQLGRQLSQDFFGDFPLEVEDSLPFCGEVCVFHHEVVS